MKKTIITFCTAAIVTGTIFTSCKKQVQQPQNRLNAGSANVSSATKTGSLGFTGGTTMPDSTKTKVNP